MRNKKEKNADNKTAEKERSHSGRRKTRMYLLLGLYILLSAFGLIFIKLGVNKCLSLSVMEGTFSFQMGTMVFIGVLMYFISFLISMAVISKMNLAIFYPVSMGLIYVFVCVGGYFILDEKLSLYQIIGAVLVLGGLAVMNIKAK